MTEHLRPLAPVPLALLETRETMTTSFFGILSIAIAPTAGAIATAALGGGFVAVGLGGLVGLLLLLGAVIGWYLRPDADKQRWSCYVSWSVPDNEPYRALHLNLRKGPNGVHRLRCIVRSPSGLVAEHASVGSFAASGPDPAGVATYLYPKDPAGLDRADFAAGETELVRGRYVVEWRGRRGDNGKEYRLLRCSVTFIPPSPIPPGVDPADVPHPPEG